MGKYITSSTKGILKLLGEQDPLFAVGAAAGSWLRDYETVVRQHRDELRTNYINGINEYIRDPRRVQAARRALTEWYRILEAGAGRLRAVWAEARQELAAAFREVAQQMGILERLRGQFGGGAGPVV